MVLKVEEYLKPISDILDVKLENKSFLPFGGISFTGTMTNLLKKTNSSLKGRSPEEIAELHQWIEYCMVYVAQIDSSDNVSAILNDLNVLLASKTYLVGNRFTIADVLLYLMLGQVMVKLTLVEKSRYMNVSRWFDNVQQNVALRRSNKIIDFSTNYLSRQVQLKN